MSSKELKFTGERFLPSCVREIWYEHYHRYTMALSWVKGLDVLDAACGEGYGSNMLSSAAKSVTGVDIDNDAINHAKNHYQNSNLNFIESNVLSMEFPDNSFDVVVSFETLEHLGEQEELLNEFRRVLRPDGILIISTPDKKEYSDKMEFDNEFHVKELYRDEFKELLTPHFKFMKWFGQKLLFASAIWQLDHKLSYLQYDCLNSDGEVKSLPLFNPVYFIVVASNDDFSNMHEQNYYLFTEEDETVYDHYNLSVRAQIKAEKQCMALNAEREKWLNHPIIGRCIKWFGKE